MFVRRCAIVFVGFGLLCRLDAAGQERDYLSPESRARVERLKAEVARERTSVETVVERARVLWEWANAFSLRGGVIPVELTMVCGMVLAWEGEQPIPVDPLVYLDRYVHELTVREQQPDAIGTLTSSQTAPMGAGSYQSIAQTYTVGTMPMVPGGGVLAARHFMTNSGFFQTANPAADDYVTVKASKAGSRFTVASYPMAGMHGGFRDPVDSLVFRLEGETLTKGDTITITYGDRSGGSKGFRIQTYSNDRMPLPVYVDLEGNDNFFTLPIIEHKVVGTAVSGVHAFAPSIVAVGEAFEVSVRSEDRYFNRATGPIPAYQVLVNGKPFRDIAAGTEAITVLKEVRFDESGIYRFAIRSADGSIVGIGNPVWVREDPPYRIYWGETHGHCGYAEGQGTPEGFFTFGRDDARLDFLTLSEHDIWLDDYEWAHLGALTRKFNQEGAFITILGYEWSQNTNRGGHHNVFFRTTEGRKRMGVHEAPTLSALYQKLREHNAVEDVLIIPHAHEAGEWRMNDPEMEKLVEIMSMHGTFEWFGNAYLKQGFELGFVAASDDHLSHPGYTGTLPRGLFQRGGLAAVLAPEKTTDAIFEAMKRMATYATTGERIILETTLNGQPVGTRIAAAESRTVRAKAIGTAPIESMSVIKNGDVVWTKDYLTDVSGTSQTLLVSIWSTSDQGVRGLPRQFKPWNGSIEVKGAKVKSAKPLRLQNVYADRVAVDGDNKVSFTFMTRGRSQDVLVELDGARPSTELTVNIDAGIELRPGTAIFVPIAQTPASTQTFRLRELEKGLKTFEYRVLRYTDRVQIRTVHTDAPMEQDIEFTDPTPPNDGDYYYVRAVELGGGMAWSSPIWVGGFRTR